jgi:hypothetical protein
MGMSSALYNLKVLELLLALPPTLPIRPQSLEAL